MPWCEPEQSDNIEICAKIRHWRQGTKGVVKVRLKKHTWKNI